jgi:hypothetical protein
MLAASTSVYCLCRVGPGNFTPSLSQDPDERLHKVRPEDLTENSVLFGTPARITETLKKVEAAGFEEVICYFNVGLKPHAQVKDEMAQFMDEVAPAFEGKHKQRTAA